MSYKYELVIHKSANKYLNRNAELKKRVKSWLEDALNDPHNHHDGKLKGIDPTQNPIYKKRIGDFRILFHIFDDKLILQIIKIASRGQAYKE